MNFCPKCGRQRSGDARFCGGCGHEYSGAATGDGTVPAQPVAEVAQDRNVETALEPGGWDRPADATRWDLTPEPTRMDLPGSPPTAQQPGPGEPDPFASWFVPGTSPEPPTETVVAHRTTPGAGYPPPPQPTAPPYPPAPRLPAPPYPPAPGRRSSGGRRALWIVVPLVVALAAGGAAYALTRNLGKHPAAQSSTTPTVHASAATASTPPASPATSASAASSPTATPAASPSLVAIGPGVGSNAATPPVETLLTHYFQGINTHNYAEYASTLTAQNKANQPESNFESGYATTTDSGITLTSLTNTGNGGLTATVTFTSHQAAADSNDNSTCNGWELNFALVPNGTGYLVAPAPPGSATETAC